MPRWPRAWCLALLTLASSGPQSVWGQSPGDLARQQPVEVLAVATRENEALRNLRESANHFGYTLRILGHGLNFTRTGLKVDLFLEALADLPDERVVMCVDSYDLIMMAPSPFVERTFREMGSPIVMASERGCWPEAFCSNMASVQYTIDQRTFLGYPFLNSGGYIGFAGAVREMLTEVASVGPVYEDQQAISHYYLTHQHDPARLIQLDTRAKIFICLTLLNPGEMAWAPNIERYYSRHTGEVPLVYHGNGDDGSELLIALMDEHPPPFRVNTSAWNKTTNSPLKQAFSFWVLDDPDQFAPTHLPGVDQIHFWYRQGAVALSSGRIQLSLKSFGKAYDLFLQHHHLMSEHQRAEINRGLTDIKDRFMKAMQDHEKAETGDQTGELKLESSR